MFKGLKSVISIFFSIFKFFIIKIIRFKTFHFSVIERFSPSTMVNVWPKGSLFLGKRVSAHSGTKLSVTNGGILSVGDRVAFNYNCIISCREKIEIGSNTTFGPGVIVYDHDHDFRTCNKMNSGKYVSSEVIIGENCWIGANTVILRGTKIGDNCVVGAGSVIKGIFPANSLIVQKRRADIFHLNVMD